MYRHEVTQAAVNGLLESIVNFQKKDFRPIDLDDKDSSIKGQWNRRTQQSDYKFTWSENANDILRKINAADSSPGVLIDLLGESYFVFGGHLEENLTGAAGQILAKRNKAICIACRDKAIWLTQLKANRDGAIKLPATIALAEKSIDIPLVELSPFEKKQGQTFQEIYYQEENEIAYIHFDFYNGAMDTDQCNRLRKTIVEAKKRAIKLIVLMGGKDIWSNGIHLNVIENANNPADESWANINAIDDLILEIIQSPNHYIIAALQGNAGAGGVALALAGDKVVAREGIVLNPHTKNMGLYGSEYWTYLLPKRIGIEKANHFTQQCLPWGTKLAKEIGLLDDVFGQTAFEFRKHTKKMAKEIVALPYFDKLLLAKKFQRKKDERVKPLEKYRTEELEKMYDNFYNNNQGYHEKRFRFVHKIFDPTHGQSVEDRDWYSSRRKIYRRRKWEAIDYARKVR
ncbi:MAG TPA: hydrogenase maturation protein [Saprospiraceae bacterium]|nr:hydrogenase maturation protein [Saprospiraceae bacterium]